MGTGVFRSDDSRQDEVGLATRAPSPPPLDHSLSPICLRTSRDGCEDRAGLPDGVVTGYERHLDVDVSFSRWRSHMLLKPG